MADEYSFDIVSEVNLQYIDDVVNTANKEISVRFDFRGSVSRLDIDKEKNEITLYSDDTGKLKSVVQIFQSRAAKRGVDLKAFDFQKEEASLGGKVRQIVKIQQGLNQEKAKEIVADIKKSKEKVTPSIKGDQIRVSSKSKDVLQNIIQLLKGKNYGIPLQFTNYR
ncbi:YajQ family cyclic di-GMP-binding protein [bacterium F11]|nr:YajQ family cyclic di-GMP-binding protein [bacterium F11]